MQLLGKIITRAIMVGFITIIIEAMLYRREASANDKKEKPFYE